MVCFKVSYLHKPEVIDNLFAFYYYRIKAPQDVESNYLGLLAVIDKNGITFPLGEWKDWCFSEQLKFAQGLGYVIKVLNGYTFSKSNDVFKDYVHKIYAIKTNPIDETPKSRTKSLLNYLLGRFGIRLEKTVTKILVNDSFEVLSRKKSIVSHKATGDTKTLTSYLPILSPELILCFR